MHCQRAGGNTRHGLSGEHRLDELFGIRLEGHESSTIAGLVSELAGRIPKKGEVVEDEALKFEVLDSTDRKVERVRITAVEPKQMKLI